MRKASGKENQESIVWRDVNISPNENPSIVWLIGCIQYIFKETAGEYRGNLVKELEQSIVKGPNVGEKGKERKVESEENKGKNIKVKKEFEEIINDIDHYAKPTFMRTVPEISEDDVYFAYLNVRLAKKSSEYMKHFIELAEKVINVKKIEASEDFKKNSEELIRNLGIYDCPPISEGNEKDNRDKEVIVKKYTNTRYRIYINGSSRNREHESDEKEVDIYIKKIKDSIECLFPRDEINVSNESTYVCMKCEESMELGKEQRLELAKKDCYHILCSECVSKCPYCKSTN